MLIAVIILVLFYIKPLLKVVVHRSGGVRSKVYFPGRRIVLHVSEVHLSLVIESRLHKYSDRTMGLSSTTIVMNLISSQRSTVVQNNQ